MMAPTKRLRPVLWTGPDFATSLVLQSGAVLTFTSLYVAPQPQGFCLKERVWQQGAIQSSKDVATGLTRRMALHAFHAAIEPFRIRASSSAQRQLHMSTHSPLPWHVPTPGDRVTTLRPVEASFSGSEGLPSCCFEPGDVGVLVSINVPAVRHVQENPSDLFATADFEKPGFVSGDGPGRCTWNCHLYYHQIIALTSLS